MAGKVQPPRTEGHKDYKYTARAVNSATLPSKNALPEASCTRLT
jgi:hypothetical protein